MFDYSLSDATLDAPLVQLEEELEMQRLKAWSHSRMVTFEQCRLRAKLAFIDRIPEPERPLPPGKTEHANDRGTRVHEAAELFVKGGVELIPELQKFRPEMEVLRELYAKGQVSMETEWGYNREWEPVAWHSSDVWCRIKADVLVHLNPTHGVVIDHKTGKRWGNEVKHTEQVQLYTVAAYLRYPELEKVTVELWYLDLDELWRENYTREQAERFLIGFTKRGVNITSEEDFQPNPNSYSCKWCPYRPAEKGGSGHCPVGV